MRIKNFTIAFLAVFLLSSCRSLVLEDRYMCLEEVLVIETDDESAVISPSGEGIVCTGYSERGIRKDITSSRDYSWSVSPE